MSKGRRPSPNKAPKGTSHHEDVLERTVEIVEQTHDVDLAHQIADELPDELPRQVFLRSVDELGGRLRDSDLEALRIMALALYRHSEAQVAIEQYGLVVTSALGNLMPNPALKIARDEAGLYLKIADQYALTFVSRLRAGLMQLAGESMMEQLHAGVAGAIVDRILAIPKDERLALTTGAPSSICQECGRVFKSRRGLATHRARMHPPKKKGKRRKP